MKKVVLILIAILLITGVFMLIQSLQKFPFSDAPNTRCFTCCHVLEDNKPILYVSHDTDGDWQFLCGQDHTVEEAKIVSLEEILTLDKATGKLAKLQCGEYAEKDTITGKWVVGKKG